MRADCKARAGAARHDPLIKTGLPAAPFFDLIKFSPCPVIGGFIEG